MRFYHPRTRELVRESLGTHDAAKAELVRERIELEAALLEPRFQAADIPAAIHATLGIPDRANIVEEDAPVAQAVSPGSPRPPQAAVPRQPLDWALQMYMGHIRSGNAALHVENKISILRRFLCDERVATVLGFKKTGGKPIGDVFFKGEFLDEFTPRSCKNLWRACRSRPRPSGTTGSSSTTSSSSV